MTCSRLASSLAALLVLSACFEGRELEVRTFSLDHLTSAQAEDLAHPYLSDDGRVFRSTNTLNAITVRDRRQNVSRIANLISQRDASPSTVSLHFQVVRASNSGVIDSRLEYLAGALGDIMRFNGYELMSEAVVSASERGVVEQMVAGGDLPLQLGVQIKDLRGGERSGSAELVVDLRGKGTSLLTTNVVVPMGQTVVLGSAYPGADGEALILTVRGEMGSRRVRSSSGRPRPSRAPRAEGDAADDVEILIAPAKTGNLGKDSRAVGGSAPVGGVRIVPPPPPSPR